MTADRENQSSERAMASKTLATLSLTLFLLSSLCTANKVPCTPKIPTPTVPQVPPKGPPVNPFCPWDTVKLAACASLLGGVSDLAVGAPFGSRCCTLLEGLADAEAAACLCTTVSESVLGITTEWSVTLSLLASTCKKEIPDGFKCV
uniref:Bifunctional inhibitor/plant lipid transfer protein/seed storage helical domain-containing protein n=1 Tax=Ananas comosus var. bracteatus TaxID=296719 RepID=A0A6V7P563_ANACO|nr:unnamed protein product [Ananas comosus var. bracteatus]